MALPTYLNQPYVWLANDFLVSLNGGTVGTDVSDVWEDSGTRGTDWADPGMDTVLLNTTNYARERNLPDDITGAAGNNPTSITIGLVFINYSVNTETIMDQSGVFQISQASATRAMTITLGGSESFEVTDDLADIGSFNGEIMTIIRFTEGISNGTLDVWINGLKVIDAQSTTLTSLPASSNDWEFGERDHYYLEMFMYEEAISDTEVDEWFGYWAWESPFGTIEWQSVLASGHPYEDSGPTAQALAALPAEFDLFESGKHAVVRLKRQTAPETFGAWSEIDWSWSEDAQDIIDGITIYEDGVEVAISRMIRQSTSRSENPQAAILDPHVTDNNFDTSGNFVEFAIELERRIEKDLDVTWDLDADLITEGDDGNGSLSGEMITINRTLYHADINDYLDSTARGVFVSKADGTIPKLPDLENGLTADQTYSDQGLIAASDVNGNANALFVIDMQLTAANGHSGTIFEVGDTTAGIWVGIISDEFIVRCGTSATAMTINENVETAATFLPKLVDMSVGIHINGTQIDIYCDGVLTHTQDDVDPSGWIAASNNGAVGTVNGDFMYSDVAGSAPSNANLSISEVRFYENPTLNVVLGSKDWYPVGISIRPRDYYIGKAWEADYTKYLYTKSDIADVENPGSVNSVSDPDFASFILNEGTEFGFNRDDIHEWIAYKSGETWIGGTDFAGTYNQPWSVRNYWLAPGSAINRDRPIVRLKYDGSSIVTFDMSANGVRSHSLTSWQVIQDKAFKIEGKGDDDDNSVYSIACVTGTPKKEIWCGGTWFQNLGSGAIGTTNANSLTEDDRDTYGGWVFGEMCYDSIALASSRGSCFSTAGPSDLAIIERIMHAKSYWGCKYNAGGFSNNQAHGAYIKGWIPYIFIEGGWVPEGPGGAWKADSHRDIVIEDWVGWEHKGFTGLHNNGSDGEEGEDGWTATTDRSIRAGRHSERVLFQDFYGAEADDFASTLVSAVNCEIRRGILTSLISQSGLQQSDVGNSAKPGENGGDSWYSGWQEITSINPSSNLLRLSWQNDRTENHSYGNHYGYWNRMLLVAHDPENDDVFEIESRNDVNLSSYNEVVTSGGITSWRFTNSHMYGNIIDWTGSDTTLSALKTSMTGGGTAIADTTLDGEVVFNESPYNVDPLLVYFVENGYADYEAVEAAISASWEDGWDAMPDVLKTENILSAMKNRLTPTNLDASDYGDYMPGLSVQGEIVPPDDGGDDDDDDDGGDDDDAVVIARSLDFRIAPKATMSPRFRIGTIRPDLSQQNDCMTESMIQEIIISSQTQIEFDPVEEGYEIRYTVNARHPTYRSKLYDGPILLEGNLSGSDNTVIKARIYDKNNSRIHSRTTKIVIRVV